MYIARSNFKLRCSIFDLPVGVTCAPNTQCSKYCYAKKAAIQYPNVKKSRLNNYEASKRASFMNDVIDELKNRPVKVVRIHSAGDFYSRDYIMKWFGIAYSLPNFRFYAYTKRCDIINHGLLRSKPPNFKMIYSVDGIVDAVYDKARIEAIVSLTMKTGYDKVAIVVPNSQNNCPAIADKNKKCQVDCFKCSDDEVGTLIKLGVH